MQIHETDVDAAYHRAHSPAADRVEIVNPARTDRHNYGTIFQSWSHNSDVSCFCAELYTLTLPRAVSAI